MPSDTSPDASLPVGSTLPTDALHAPGLTSDLKRPDSQNALNAAGSILGGKSVDSYINDVKYGEHKYKDMGPDY